MNRPNQPPTQPITLFGATGYTGQKIAQKLARESLPFRIAGRSEERLKRLSRELSTQPDWLLADAASPATLHALCKDTSLLINCAGPFTDLGERVIIQAAMNGVHYLDITNELGYVFRVRGYGEMAKRHFAALAPACGFEVALADCAAYITGSRLLEQDPDSPLDEVNVVYDLGGWGSSAGTRRSAVRALGTSWIAYRGGEWTGEIPSGRVQSFDLPALGERLTAFSFPSSETVSVPYHLPVLRVNTWMTAGPLIRVWAPVLVPIAARLSRSIFRGLILSIAARGGQPAGTSPQSEPGRGSPFTIYVCARQSSRSRWMTISGSDPYEITAEIIAYAAGFMTGTGYDRRGLLAPSQALDPRALLAHGASSWGLRIEEG